MTKIIKILPALIVIAALVLAVSSVWNDSPIVDEIPHIGAGYSYVAKLDSRLNPEHPPLAKDLAGFALNFMDLNQSAFNSRFWLRDVNGQWEFGRHLLFTSGNDAITAVRVAKIPELLFFVFSGILIFVWAKKMYGDKAAVLALFLFSFSPTVIAHSRFVTIFFVRYLKNPSVKNLVVAGLALGVAELTKFSLFLLIPFFILLAAFYGLLIFSEKRWKMTLFYFSRTLIIVLTAYIFVVWPMYALHVKNYPPSLQRTQTENILSSFGRRSLADTVAFFADKPVIRGLADYGLGLLMVTQRSVGGNTTYFMGEVRNYAWKQYFPIVYFLKEPLPFWILLILIWLFWSMRVRFEKNVIQQAWHWFVKLVRNHFTEFAMLLWLATYWYSSITANLNIGVRHLMPTYGFIFILLSGQLVKIYKLVAPKKLFAFTFALYALLGWYLYENLSIYPYYLTYFNQVAGGPAGGYRYVVDSNIDWGQDAKRLADWAEDNDVKKIYFDYFGWADARYYLKDKFMWLRGGQFKNAAEFLRAEPKGGYIAVSATFFMGSFEKPETSYAWLENYPKKAVIGNSIFVWYIPPVSH